MKAVVPLPTTRAGVSPRPPGSSGGLGEPGSGSGMGSGAGRATALEQHGRAPSFPSQPSLQTPVAALYLCAQLATQASQHAANLASQQQASQAALAMQHNAMQQAAQSALQLQNSAQQAAAPSETAPSSRREFLLHQQGLASAASAGVQRDQHYQLSLETLRPQTAAQQHKQEMGRQLMGMRVLENQYRFGPQEAGSPSPTQG